MNRCQRQVIQDSISEIASQLMTAQIFLIALFSEDAIIDEDTKRIVTATREPKGKIVHLVRRLFLLDDGWQRLLTILRRAQCAFLTEILEKRLKFLYYDTITQNVNEQIVPLVISPTVWTFVADHLQPPRPLDHNLINKLQRKLKRLYNGILSYVQFPPHKFEYNEKVDEVFVEPCMVPMIAGSRNMKQLFKNALRTSEAVVVSGESGIGKTTIFKKILVDWANKVDTWTSEYQLILSANLLDCTYLKSESRLLDIPFWWLSSKVRLLQCEETRQTLITWIALRMIRVLVIFDSLEHAPVSLRSHCFAFLGGSDTFTIPFDVIILSQPTIVVGLSPSVKVVTLTGFDIFKQEEFRNKNGHKLCTAMKGSVMNTNGRRAQSIPRLDTNDRPPSSEFTQRDSYLQTVNPQSQGEAPAINAHHVKFDLPELQNKKGTLFSTFKDNTSAYKTLISLNLLRYPIPLSFACVLMTEKCRPRAFETSFELLSNICALLGLSYADECNDHTNRTYCDWQNDELFIKFGKMAFECLVLDESFHIITDDILKRCGLYSSTEILLKVGVMTLAVPVGEIQWTRVCAPVYFKFIDRSIQEHLAGLYLANFVASRSHLIKYLMSKYNSFWTIKQMCLAYSGFVKHDRSLLKAIEISASQQGDVYDWDEATVFYHEGAFCSRSVNATNRFSQALTRNILLLSHTTSVKLPIHMSISCWYNILHQLCTNNKKPYAISLYRLINDCVVCKFNKSAIMLLQNGSVQRDYVKQYGVSKFWFCGNPDELSLFLSALSDTDIISTVRIDVMYDDDLPHQTIAKPSLTCDTLLLNFSNVFCRKVESICLCPYQFMSLFSGVKTLIIADCAIEISLAHVLSVAPKTLSVLLFANVQFATGANRCLSDNYVNLTSLAFRKCFLVANDVLIALALAPNLSRLEILYCNGTGGLKPSETGKIMELISVIKSMTTFKMNGAKCMGHKNSIQEIFSNAKFENATLKELWFNECNLSEQHVDALAQYIFSKGQLFLVMLQGNNFCESGMRRLKNLCTHRGVTLHL